jgi:hypothetical protein
MKEMPETADSDSPYSGLDIEVEAIRNLHKSWVQISLGINPETGIEKWFMRTSSGKWIYKWIEGGITRRLYVLAEDDSLLSHYDGVDI